jgi:uncharacterized protein (DUF488 family)
MTQADPQIYTIGHSNRPLEDFIRLLQTYSVNMLVDVRTMPRSRHNPQFNTDTLPTALQPYAIAYEHSAGLGGLRRPQPDSPNGGWRNLSFRGYADYMLTPAFQESLQALVQLAMNQRVAIMCAEAVPWRCHRSLIADALLVGGWRVADIIAPTSCKPHTLPAWARIVDGTLTYPLYESVPKS